MAALDRRVVHVVLTRREYEGLARAISALEMETQDWDKYTPKEEKAEMAAALRAWDKIKKEWFG